MTSIYPILNWENLDLTIPFVLFALAVILPVIHCFIWALHILRQRTIVGRINRDNMIEQRNSQGQGNSARVFLRAVERHV